MEEGVFEEVSVTFLPSGMAARSTSTLAWASTSAEADMLTRKSRMRGFWSAIALCTASLVFYSVVYNSKESVLKIFLTLHGCLCPRCRQESHSSDHEVLEGLIASLAFLAHVVCETRYLCRRVVFLVFERGVETWCLIILARNSIYDVGFRAPLSGDARCWEGGKTLTGA